MVSAGSSIGTHLRSSIQAHSGPCNVVRYNTLGRYILTGGSDRTIQLYNASSIASSPAEPIQPIKSYTSHSHEVLSLSITRDNTHFASGGGDKSVFLWDVSTGSIVRRFSSHVGKINAVEFGGAPTGGTGGESLLFTAGYDGTVRSYDLRAQGAWKPITELKDAKDAVLTLAVTASCIYSGSVDGHVRSYDLRNGRITTDLVDHPVASVRPSRNQTSLLVSTLDSAVRLFDAESGECLQTLRGHTHGQYRCRAVFSNEEDAVVMGDEEGRLAVWDVVTAARREVVPRDGQRSDAKAHAKAILWTEVNPVAEKENEVVTAGADGMVRVWTSGGE